MSGTSRDGRTGAAGDATTASSAVDAVPQRPRRRWPLVAAAVVVVVAGLTVRAVSEGTLTSLAGDALYAVLVTIVVAFLAPGLSTRRVAGVALAICVAVELLQLTGLPAALVEIWWPVRLVLGTTFGWVDLVAYAVGVGATMPLDTRAPRRP